MRLFQNLHVTQAEGKLVDLGSPTTRKLFAYLVLHHDRPVDRRQLAFLFWPDVPEADARRNLRQYLHRLRRSLEAAGVPAQQLLVEEPSLQFTARDMVWVDVEVFKSGCLSDSGLDQMSDAAALYTGDLLPEFYQDWCEAERSTLRQEYLNLLDRLSQVMQNQGRIEDTINYALKWTQAEPLDEAAHRRLMTAYAQAGHRHRALAQYQSLQSLLDREIGCPPLPETQALAKLIQNGAFEQEPPPVAHPAIQPGRVTYANDLFLVGRQTELSLLNTNFQQAQDNKGGMVMITGESGIGKTRLVQEYLAQHSNLVVLQGTCNELEAAVPFALLRQLFIEAGQLLPVELLQAPPVWLLALAKFFPALLGQSTYRQPVTWQAPETALLSEQLDHLLFYLAGARPTGQPLHLILDDLQWADGLTWDFLAQFARQATALPIVIIGLCRLEDIPRERTRTIRFLERSGFVRHIPLQRLTLDETLQLARQLLPDGRVDELFLNRLYKESEGIPFFVIETTRALLDLTHQEGAQGSSLNLSLPLSIQHVIEARLDRLSEPAQELLPVAAAIGRAFTFQLLVQVSHVPAEQAVPVVEEWMHRGLVSEVTFTLNTGLREPASQRYDFSHDKIRQVAYSSMSQARRQYVHRCIAEVFELAIPASEPATLAYHFARSDQPLRALPYLTQAGEQALQVRSYYEARLFGQRAVSLLGQMPGPRDRAERVDLNLQLVQAFAFSGDLDRALEILEETQRLAQALDDLARLARIYHRSAQIFWLRGQPQAAGDYARRTLRSAEELEDTHLLRSALRMLGRVGIALSMYDDAIAYLQRYANMVQHPPDLAIVMGYLGVAHARVGAWDRALQAAQTGVELAEKEGSSQAISFARMQLGFVYADLRRWDLCQETIQQIPDPLESPLPVEAPGGASLPVQLTPTGFMLLGLRGRVYAYQGNHGQAQHTISIALEWAERTGYRVFHYLPRMFLVECLLLAQQPVQAVQEANAAIAQARDAGNRWGVGLTLRFLAEAQIRLPRPDWSLIEDHLIESMNLLRQVRARPDLARTYLALRRLYDRVGQIAWAVDCHFRATTIYEELGMLDELRQAQGQSASERGKAKVLTGVQLRGPNLPIK